MLILAAAAVSGTTTDWVRPLADAGSTNSTTQITNNFDQSLNTTDNVEFVNVTALNITTVGDSSMMGISDGLGNFIKMGFENVDGGINYPYIEGFSLTGWANIPAIAVKNALVIIDDGYGDISLSFYNSLNSVFSDFGTIRWDDATDKFFFENAQGGYTFEDGDVSITGENFIFAPFGSADVIQNVPMVISIRSNKVAKDQYSSVIRFDSTAAVFTTDNPKTLAGIAFVPAERYNSDESGGSRIDFFTSPNQVGVTESPVRAGYYDENGDHVVLFNQTVVGNLSVKGHVSYAIPHLSGYDNSTQSFLTLGTAQVMNITNSAYHSHKIAVVENQNVTFEVNGHYEICTSPQFYQDSGNNKLIEFWIQENGVDIAWSNSRYTMNDDEYYAPRICWETTVTNYATDNIRIMWVSDSTASQIASISSLSTPTRPSIPAVIMDVKWISNGV